MADSEFQQGPPPEPGRGEEGRRPEDREGDEAFQQEPTRERPRRQRQRYPEDDEEDEPRIRRDDPVEALIPYRNARALTAYYLGVFSLIPCLGLLLGPAALVLGILGWRYSRRHPTAHGGGHAIAGIVLGFLTSAGNWGVLLFGAGMAVFHR